MSPRKISLSVTAALLALAATGSMVRAAYVETVQQVGSNVVATGSGTINTAALTLNGSATNVAILNPGGGLAFFGPASATFSDEYSGFTSGSSDFGSNHGVDATSGSGDLVGVAGLTDLIVPNGYVSGTPLSDSSTWSNQTLDSLGLTEGPGDYAWEWGQGPTFDSFFLDVEGTEPALLGDANMDGIVNGLDLAILMSHYGTVVTGGSSVGDFNNDGVVNADDLALFQLGVAEYDLTVGNSVPEPASASLLAIGSLALLARRRQLREQI
jgi:hypothetical protein